MGKADSHCNTYNMGEQHFAIELRFGCSLFGLDEVSSRLLPASQSVV